jgi:hypothetical protein
VSGTVRLNAVWGSETVLETAPAVERLRDVLYMPWAAERPWGLFDRDGLGLPASWELEPQGSPVPPAHTAFRIEQPAAADPAGWGGAEALRDDLIYGGRMHLHFGHFLLETLNRFWSLREGGAGRTLWLVHGPADLRAWFGIPWMSTLLGALGLSRENFVWSDRPLRCRRLTLPHPSFRPQSHAHRAFGLMCRRIGDRLLAGADGTPDPRPVYLSKSRLRSGVIRVANEAEIEAVLARAGVEIVHPETLPLAAQVALFARRPAVLGTTGSAFHLACSPRPRRGWCA